MTTTQTLLSPLATYLPLIGLVLSVAFALILKPGNARTAVLLGGPVLTLLLSYLLFDVIIRHGELLFIPLFLGLALLLLFCYPLWLVLWLRRRRVSQ